MPGEGMLHLRFDRRIILNRLSTIHAIYSLSYYVHTIMKITYKWRKSCAMHHVRFCCSQIAFYQRNIDQVGIVVPVLRSCRSNFLKFLNFVFQYQCICFVLRDGPLFFWRGGWKILKKIVCKDKKVQVNCLHT